MNLATEKYSMRCLPDPAGSRSIPWMIAATEEGANHDEY